MFNKGIDLYDIVNLGKEISKHDDIARKSKIVRNFIKTYQDCVSALEKVRKRHICYIMLC